MRNSEYLKKIKKRIKGYKRIINESEVNKFMAYQYETSPRKIKPEYNPKTRTSRKEYNKHNEDKEKRELEEKKHKRAELKQEKRRHHKNIALIVGMFLILLAISYRNSLITERFNDIQQIKQELSAIQKTNEQTEVSIESNLNLKNLEKSAESKLGMQKLEKDQKVYITLPKQDYTESANQEIIREEKETNWFKKLIEKIIN